MSSLNLLPIFMIGLLGSVHCVGMCGGIVGFSPSILGLPLARPTGVGAGKFEIACIECPMMYSGLLLLADC